MAAKTPLIWICHDKLEVDGDQCWVKQEDEEEILLCLWILFRVRDHFRERNDLERVICPSPCLPSIHQFNNMVEHSCLVLSTANSIIWCLRNNSSFLCLHSTGGALNNKWRKVMKMAHSRVVVRFNSLIDRSLSRSVSNVTKAQW